MTFVSSQSIASILDYQLHDDGLDAGATFDHNQVSIPCQGGANAFVRVVASEQAPCTIIGLRKRKGFSSVLLIDWLNVENDLFSDRNEEEAVTRQLKLLWGHNTMAPKAFTAETLQRERLFLLHNQTGLRCRIAL